MMFPKFNLTSLIHGTNLQLFQIQTQETVLNEPFLGSNSKTSILFLLTSQNILCCALQVSIYTTGSGTSVYIDKLDTSGYYNGPLARQLVQGFVNQLPEHSRLHVFARAQPEFLFHSSSKNPNKRVLTERNLVKWWARSLSQCHVKGWYYVPGETLPSTKDIHSQLNASWSFGWPYAPSEKAYKVIPRFTDDAKIKALKLIDKASTMNEFEQVLQVTGECGSGRFSGFFICDVQSLTDQDNNNNVDVILNKEDGMQENTIILQGNSKLSETTLIEWNEIHTLLHSLCFSTKENAESSSLKFIKKLKDMGIHGDVIAENVSLSNQVKKRDLIRVEGEGVQPILLIKKKFKKI